MYIPIVSTPRPPRRGLRRARTAGNAAGARESRPPGLGEEDCDFSSWTLNIARSPGLAPPPPPKRTATWERNRYPGRFPWFSDGSTEGDAPYHQGGIPGLAIDVGQVALLTARFVLETIAITRNVDLGVASLGADHVLWSNSGGWIFDTPQQLLRIDHPRDPACPVCGEASDGEPLSPDERADLARAFAEAVEPSRLAPAGHLDVG